MVARSFLKISSSQYIQNMCQYSDFSVVKLRFLWIPVQSKFIGLVHSEVIKSEFLMGPRFFTSFWTINPFFINQSLMGLMNWCISHSSTLASNSDLRQIQAIQLELDRKSVPRKSNLGFILWISSSILLFSQSRHVPFSTWNQFTFFWRWFTWQTQGYKKVLHRGKSNNMIIFPTLFMNIITHLKLFDV